MIYFGARDRDGAVIGIRIFFWQGQELYAIVGGNPSKTVGKRFDKVDIARMLELLWWAWSHGQLQVAMPDLTSGDIRAFHRQSMMVSKSAGMAKALTSASGPKAAVA